MSQDRVIRTAEYRVAYGGTVEELEEQVTGYMEEDDMYPCGSITVIQEMTTGSTTEERTLMQPMCREKIVERTISMNPGEEAP